MADKTRKVIVLGNGRGGKVPEWAEPVRETYWYEATVMRNRNGMAVTRLQQGSLQATSALDALDKLDARAKEVWRGTIVKSKVCEVDKNGVIVATTESPEKEIKKDYTPYDDYYDDKKIEMWEWTSRWTPPNFRTYKG